MGAPPLFVQSNLGGGKTRNNNNKKIYRRQAEVGGTIFSYTNEFNWPFVLVTLSPFFLRKKKDSGFNVVFLFLRQ